jgi:hypothetical protein
LKISGGATISASPSSAAFPSRAAAFPSAGRGTHPRFKPARIRPLYASASVVRADGPSDAAGQLSVAGIGWTARHSQSGFNALQDASARDGKAGTALSRSVGPLLTPRRVIEAVLDDASISGRSIPISTTSAGGTSRDGGALRIVATTAADADAVAGGVTGGRRCDSCGLQETLSLRPGMRRREILTRLRLSGFALVEPGGYQVLIREADIAEHAGYTQPG